MILVFGGTTEGRCAAEVLEVAGKPFYYSTKTGEQHISLHHGVRIDGVMNGNAMCAFCREHQIRLIVDAAHPFAATLHQTIAEVVSLLQIPLIRYDRIYPPRDPDIEWIDDYGQVPSNMHSLLATTGVQSIGKLKWLESKGVKVIYRILNRDSSISLAYQQGATDDQLCFYEDGNTIDVDAEAILLKESGITGGFMEKVAEARRRGMRIIALKRPEINYQLSTDNGSLSSDNGSLLTLNSQLSTVNGPHGLRRMVEKLLPDFFPMKTGLTTGACATAAVKAALLSLMGEESDEVTFALPDGETLSVPVRVERLGVASVVKDFSDDPDVTRGCTITAEVRFTDSTSIRFLQGEGVGVVTLPGLGLPVGEPAVNLTPRRMIETTIRQLTDRGCDIIISVAHGEEIAQKTFNSRVGVVGGISIIGTSGIVSPLSNEAFIESVRREMEVAQAIGCVEIALVSGKTSEDALCRESNIRCIHYGNFVGEALKAAAKLGFRHVVLAIMIGKAVKLAEGHLDTHSHKVTMNKEFIQRMLDEAHVAVDLSSITLARELWKAIPQNKLHDFVSTMIRHCEEHCSPLVPNSILTIRLIDDNGKIYEI